jgi:aspartate carbamoyltransferase catalytic subunit
MRNVPPRNLIDVDDVSPSELIELIDRATAFNQTAPPRDLLAGIPVLNLFFESSTRTATSFTLAEQRVGADVISFAPGASSLGKGESFATTSRAFPGVWRSRSTATSSTRATGPTRIRRRRCSI